MDLHGVDGATLVFVAAVSLAAGNLLGAVAAAWFCYKPDYGPSREPATPQPYTPPTLDLDISEANQLAWLLGALTATYQVLDHLIPGVVSQEDVERIDTIDPHNLTQDDAVKLIRWLGGDAATARTAIDAGVVSPEIKVVLEVIEDRCGEVRDLVTESEAWL